MDRREIKGVQIAHSGRISETPKGWIVPSQSGKGSYLVYKEGKETKCNCPDCEIRGTKCKHQWAVEYFIKESVDGEGNKTVEKAIRVTYSQNWTAYNKAQNEEIRLFDELLKDFYRNAEEREQINKAPSYNMVNKFLNREDITPILNHLLILSSLPLKGIETNFAPDSSGFRTSQFNQYGVEKYGTNKEHKWVKAHILTGTKTNIIASARITEGDANDSPYFEPMVKEAHGNGFNIEEIEADKGYLSRKNYDFADEIGATAYIPFKSNATSKSKGSRVWNKMYHYFMMNKEEFMEHYHQRSNVETTFMMVKTKFGDKLKSKNWIAQKNELLCKLIAHNIVVVIHEMYELGINPNFGAYNHSNS
jgi:transposase